MLRNAYNYGEYFHPGSRTRVDFHVSSRTIHEWATVVAVKGAGISLQLAQPLPAEMGALPEDAALELRIGRSGKAYRCKGRLAGAVEQDRISVMLTEHVIADEQREYFRLDTLLPMSVSRETPPSFGSKAGWQGPGARREEHSRKARYAFHLPDSPGTQDSHIVNISGGGIRAEMNEAVRTGTRVYVTFHLPLPEPREVPVVAEVVHCEEMTAGTLDGQGFSVGMRYVNIHERDRDSIVQYICAEEMKKIRRHKKSFLEMPMDNAI